MQKKQQNYGEDPLSIRKSDTYQQEYVFDFVKKWDQLIDWNVRSSSENSFFLNKLLEHGAKKVLDVATGTGFHSIQLIKGGLNVTSADGNPLMLAKAFENARMQGHILRTVQADWRWLNRDVHDLYDAVICLGNSFTHLHSENDRRKSLAEYYATLKHDGILIIDHRNYDAILDHQIEPSHNYYYCGGDVTAKPEYVDDNLARFKYEFDSGDIFHLNMYPLRKAYISRLLKEVGFQKVTTFGDFQENNHGKEPDFYIHIAEKEYQSSEK